MTTTTEFSKGDRVQLHPATNLWMRGARYGVVISATRRHVLVILDMTGKIVRVDPANLLPAEPN